MRIVVVGDTHGKVDSIYREVASIPAIDLLIHTGDHYQDGLFLAHELKVEGMVVVGNCDRGVDGPKILIKEVLGHKILVTHGHLQNVKTTMNNLYFQAKQSGCNMVFFGHTHVPYLEKVDNIWFMNPGSPTYPRAKLSTYGLVEVEGKEIGCRIIKIASDSRPT